MKFFCDNCQAQYMISDEKVGPAGVRVRCKKCSHVIYVKRIDEELPEDMTVVMTAEKLAELGGEYPAPSPASAMLIPSGDEQLAGGDESAPRHGEPPPPPEATPSEAAENGQAFAGAAHDPYESSSSPGSEPAYPEAAPPSEPGAEPGVPSPSSPSEPTAPTEAPIAAAKPASRSAAGLEEEIGQALDSMFSDGSSGATPGPVASGPSRMPVVIGGSPKSQMPFAASAGLPTGPNTGLGLDDDRAETRVFTAGDMEKIASDISSQSAPGAGAMNASGPEPSVDWFIAIRDEQVGPLKVADIRGRFESGEVAGDTLVWSAGLTDWRPLSSVEELAELIIPKRDIARARLQPEPSKEAQVKKEQPVAFKPSAASALASLASMAKEELAASSRAAATEPPVRAPLVSAPSAERRPQADPLAGFPAPAPDPAPRHTELPSYSPGYQNGRTSSPAASVPDYRQSPLAQGRPRHAQSGSNRRLIALIGVASLVLVVLIAAAAYFLAIKPQRELAAQIADQQRKEQELRIKLDAEAEAKAQLAAKVALAAAQAKPAEAAPVAHAADQGQAAAPPQTEGTARPSGPESASRGEHHGGREGRHRGGGRETAEGAPAPAASAAPPPPAKGGDDFLGAAGGGDVDKEFARELDSSSGEPGKSATKHAPYIPPPPGQNDLPAALSQSDIVGAVTQHRDAFAKCVQDQKRRDPNTTGTVVMRWKIKPDGRTSDVGAKGDEYADSPLAGCFKGQIGKLHFGAYRGAQMAPIEFPFSF